MNQIYYTGINAVRKAGEMLKKEYAKYDRTDIKLKAHNEVVTKFDLFSEEIIINEIRKSFSAHGIISEERGEIKGYSPYTWYIDPIDGTTNFFMHNPLWSISLGLAKDGELIFGAIYMPIADELFWAAKGQGAFMNKEKISVSKFKKEGKIIHTFCHGRNAKDVKRMLKYFQRLKLADTTCRQLGSAAIELAYVAAGRIESFLSAGTNDWDVAAGALLVREAGGRVTDFANKPWRLGGKDIAASNGLIHSEILKAIK